jgi:hypothetical protein
VQDNKIKGYRLAAGPTAEEFAKRVMKPTIYAAKNKLEDNPLWKDAFTEKGCAQRALYSFDGARIHESAAKEDINGRSLLSSFNGYTAALRVPLSPYSPDLHRVIEHTHARAVIKFQHWMYKNPKTHTIGQYKAVFQKQYEECCSAEVIAEDVAGLPELYNDVFHSDGHWAPRKMR